MVISPCTQNSSPVSDVQYRACNATCSCKDSIIVLWLYVQSNMGTGVGGGGVGTNCSHLKKIIQANFNIFWHY